MKMPLFHRYRPDSQYSLAVDRSGFSTNEWMVHAAPSTDGRASPLLDVPVPRLRAGRRHAECHHVTMGRQRQPDTERVQEPLRLRNQVVRVGDQQNRDRCRPPSRPAPLALPASARGAVFLPAGSTMMLVASTPASLSWSAMMKRCSSLHTRMGDAASSMSSRRARVSWSILEEALISGRNCFG